jgi:hypothetical protein
MSHLAKYLYINPITCHFQLKTIFFFKKKIENMEFWDGCRATPGAEGGCAATPSGRAQPTEP